MEITDENFQRSQNSIQNRRTNWTSRRRRQSLRRQVRDCKYSSCSSWILIPSAKTVLSDDTPVDVFLKEIIKAPEFGESSFVRRAIVTAKRNLHSGR